MESRTKTSSQKTEEKNSAPQSPFVTWESEGSGRPSRVSRDADGQAILDPRPLGSPNPVTMKVRKRNGALEPVDVNKIVARVTGNARGLSAIDPMKVALKAISGLYDGATTQELDELCIQTAALMIGDEPEYSRLAARLLAQFIEEEVSNQGVLSFADSVKRASRQELLAENVRHFVSKNAELLNSKIDHSRNDRFEYLGLQVIYDRYLLKDPTTRNVIESPQFFFMRVACGLAKNLAEAIELYDLISSLDYMPSSPTLFNSGTQHSQLSSCYLLDSPQDTLEDIYKRYMDVAKLSKFAGGIGLSFTRVRSRGSLIKGTNGLSNGIVPWLKTLDSSVSAVNQGGKRKGAACVYLEPWHADIEEFLELRDNTGDEAKRTHNLNLANWVPDLFMRRVAADGMWSLFDPKAFPELVDTFGEKFDEIYESAERKRKYVKQLKARDLYGRMMKTLAQTGNGWMTFKDSSNRKCNQTGRPENIVHLSNLCTEILETTSQRETAVCNLGSINLANYIVAGRFDFDKLSRNVRIALKYLDRVVDINFYPISTAAMSNSKWRPVGLGVMGLQDVFFKLGHPFDSAEAAELSTRIQEEVYFAALSESCRLAEENGPHPAFSETRAAQGDLQFDLWGVDARDDIRWEGLRKKIQRHGLRNSLMIAIAPTATIASMVGSFESIEPQVSNLFKRETLSGEFLQLNRYLVAELKQSGLWTPEVREKLKEGEGSIQHIEEIPPEVRYLYRTAWELPMRSIIDMAAKRGAYIDQSQSLNLFMESPTIGKLSSMYMYAWEKGLKTTYYLRSRPATRIRRATQQVKDADAVACSLENPESCESCQ